MGRELQKKKNKSGIAKVTRKPKSKKSLLLSNQIIAANWDKTQTLSQNYRRLGLANRLNGPTGGVDRRSLLLSSSSSSAAAAAGAGGGGVAGALDVRTANRVKVLVPTEVRVRRDPVSGAILSVLDEEEEEEDGGEGEVERAVRSRFRGLVDPLSAFDDVRGGLEGDEGAGAAKGPHRIGGFVGAAAAAGGVQGTEEEGVPEFLRSLQADARRPGARKVRRQSVREQEWCRRLVEAHGRDWGGMVRDLELNLGQQSEGDLRRRVERWLKGRGQGGEVTV